MGNVFNDFKLLELVHFSSIVIFIFLFLLPFLIYLNYWGTFFGQLSGVCCDGTLELWHFKLPLLHLRALTDIFLARRKLKSFEA